MPRPPKYRKVRCHGGIFGFVPIVPPSASPIEMGLDHLESLRLYDIEGLDQENAAQRMQISRATFGRIIREAHQMIAEAIISHRGLTVIAKNSIRIQCHGAGKRQRRRGRSKNDNL